MISLFRKTNLKNVIGLSLVIFGLVTSIVYAASTPDFTLKINPGTLSIDIVDPLDYSTKANPSFSIGGTSTFSSMTSVTATGILGDDTNGVIYVSNPDATSSWTASVGVSTTQWTTGGATPTVFPYNAATQAQGQLTINPSTATLTSGKSGITLDASVSLGSSGTFSNTVSSVTLAQANASAPRIADFVIKNIGVSQTIPAMTSSGDYSLGVTLSIIGDGTSSGPTVTYNGQNVSSGDVYVDTYGGFSDLTLSSSDPLTIWTSNYYNEENNNSYRHMYDLNNYYNMYGVFEYNGGETSAIFTRSDTYAISEDVIYTATSPSGVTNVTVHYGTGKDCGDNVWVSNSATCPQIITYNDNNGIVKNVTNSDIYTSNNHYARSFILSSSNSLTVWTSSSSSQYRDMSDDSGLYNNTPYPYVYVFSQSYADPEDVIYTATSSYGTASVTVHYGTGQYCSNNDTWISNSATCPI